MSKSKAQPNMDKMFARNKLKLTHNPAKPIRIAHKSRPFESSQKGF
jgi:hypothetical protein